MMPEDFKYNELLKVVTDLRVDVGVVKTDVSYLKQTVQEIREQAKRNADIANVEAATTHDLLTGGRVLRWVLITIGGIIGALFTIGRDLWKDIIKPWTQ